MWPSAGWVNAADMTRCQIPDEFAPQPPEPAAEEAAAPAETLPPGMSPPADPTTGMWFMCSKAVGQGAQVSRSKELQVGWRESV